MKKIKKKKSLNFDKQNIINGKKIKGFFGFFDVLGYKSLMNNNSLDEMINIYKNILREIDKTAITFDGLDKKQELSIGKVESFMFSDTIVLYEKENIPSTYYSTLIFKSAFLLRYAFEEGIPLRGAISFGDYYIENNCFLGRPIIEAYNYEKNQEWSGAILCPSAKVVYNDLKIKIEKAKPTNFHGLVLNPIELFSPFSNNVTLECNVPFKEGYKKEIAICWGDYIKYFFHGKMPDLTPDEFKKRVNEKFSAFGKEINDDRVKVKIKNTISFLETMEKRPIKTRLIKT